MVVTIGKPTYLRKSDLWRMWSRKDCVYDVAKITL